MNRIEALQLIEKNRMIINSDTARINEHSNAKLKASVDKMKNRFSDIVETARLCEAGEHHSLKNIKKFKSTRSPGLKFTPKNDALLYLTDIDDRLAIMRIDKDGNYSFFFSGSKTTDPKPDTVQETYIITGFLKKYERFEKRFYSYVDKKLKRQNAHINYLENKFKFETPNVKELEKLRCPSCMKTFFEPHKKSSGHKCEIHCPYCQASILVYNNKKEGV